jgi:DNA-binding transcriptional ArsR family regulator
MCWQADPLDVEHAIEGDGESIDRCFANYDEAERESLELLLTFPGDGFPETLAGVLSALVGEVMPDDTADWMEAYRCSRQAVEPLVEMMEPGDLIERVTNGMDYAIPLGVRRLVLVPSVVVRPWTITHELGDRVYVLYPVADEHLAADPDAPPQWLVHFHKALGDERRLRMLRRLADRPASLTELTAEVDLAKSTVFHHIGVLRAAGLIRVHVGSRPDKNPVYSLRLHALETAYEHTSRYLEVPERTEES